MFVSPVVILARFYTYGWMTAIRKVGMLGLGKMGAPMAQHLIAKGYNVAGYDPVDAARCAATSLGVSVRESGRGVARS
jgi:3-hydroxyisobutyrate dehydrogenase-like beta-hydroxyacid dehydrogenase